MLRYGYDRRVATGVIAASGTLAQIIPPSLVLIVMADQLGRSVGDMYAGAIIPGMVLTSLYVGWVVLVAVFKPASVPALPLEARTLGTGVASLLLSFAFAGGLGYAASIAFAARGLSDPSIWGATLGVVAIYVVAIGNRTLGLNLLSRLAERVIVVLIPPLALVFLVLGTIFLGIATPTEGGAMGAVGALLLAAAKGRLSLMVVRQALESTTKLSAFVLFILLGARVFSLTFYGVNGHIWVEELLTGLPGGAVGFLIVVNVLVFILAFFLDFFELAFIIVPLLGPVADKLGIDLIWFGVLLGINMQTSFMHPPFGFALFYLRSVAPRRRYVDKVTGASIEGVTTGQIYWGAVPFVCIQMVMVGLTIAFPQMVLHYKGTATVSNPDALMDQLPSFGPPGGGLSLPGGLNLDGPPSFGVPGDAAPAAPTLGLPPPGLGGPPPSLGASPAAPSPAPEPGGATLDGLPPGLAPPSPLPSPEPPPSGLGQPPPDLVPTAPAQ